MSAPTACFGHRTALQILRTADPAARTLLRRGSHALPASAPTASDLGEVVERLEAMHPGILIERPVHILVADAAKRCYPRTAAAHVCSLALQGRALYRLAPGVLTGSAALALVHAAQTMDAIDLLQLVFEACGSYQTKRTGVPPAYQVPSLASVKGLEEFVARNPSLRGSGKMAGILRYAADGSASARETKKALVLGLPMMRGGYGLGIPHMNFEVMASPAARALTGKSSFRCDLCWPEAKLDVEYQSRERHEGEKMRISDSRRANALASMGWTVIGVTNDELDSMAATDAIAETIRRHLGKRSPVRVSHYHARKLKLRRQLGLPVGYDDLALHAF
ncbi:DUF559 domain-containing protein [Arabiibacter massiliensis]|uniref:DUF559 domain-containing protein n=1 Tax=Arabiibacter massiliensis TaxID=1870985 RepID=UPI0009BAD962|nr:DUF559 domain-containing protein [Arabiibacter massiliensis]